MDIYINPFAPGAGTPPPELAGRQELLETIEQTVARLNRGRSCQSHLLVGLRGVGKTVMLNDLRARFESAGHQIIDIEAHDQKNLIQLLLPRLRSALQQLSLVHSARTRARQGWGSGATVG